MENILLLTDSYKLTHWKQYPLGTQTVYSYFESRGGQYEKTLFFGLQYILKEYLEGIVLTKDKIDEAKEFTGKHLGDERLFNEEGWKYILKKYNGKLPISISAVPEGTLVDTHNVLMTIENTDPNVPWLTNYLETLLVQTWYPTTVATQSYYMKRVLRGFLEKTGDPKLIDYKLHSFGSRGCSSMETVGIGGLAHLVNFKGTDDLIALKYGREYYNEKMAAHSVPATEHSTMTAWGKDNEVVAYKNVLDSFPDGLVACVSDSYDIFNACKNIWGDKLKSQILNRNGTLVIRADSGDPVLSVLEVLHILGSKFGYTINTKGYKVLNPHVRVIQGDGIDYAMMQKILTEMMIKKWSADNISFGSGGALLQKVNRDTQRFAFKCSSVTINGEERDVFKQPLNCPEKNSKAGRMKLVLNADGYKTIVRSDSEYERAPDELIEVFRNGEIVKEYSFKDVRENAEY
jgi:nicotinamide phosphoribosyltransferase